MWSSWWGGCLCASAAPLGQGHPGLSTQGGCFRSAPGLRRWLLGRWTLRGRGVSSMRNKAFKKFLDNIFFSFQRLACLKNFLEKYKEVKKNHP